MKKIAVILGGCGTKDGSEINETVTLLLALDQHGVKYQCFAWLNIMMSSKHQ